MPDAPGRPTYRLTLLGFAGVLAAVCLACVFTAAGGEPAATAPSPIPAPSPVGSSPIATPPATAAIPEGDPETATIDYAARAAAAQQHLDGLAAEVPDEALRARVAEQWREALAQWNRAEQASQNLRRNRQTIEGAPARLAAIQAENDTLRARAAVPDEAADARSAADLEAEIRDLDVNLPEWTKQLTQRVALTETQTKRLSDARLEAEAARVRLAEKQPPLPDDAASALMTASQDARMARRRADREIIAASEYFRTVQDTLVQLDTAERELLARRIEYGKTRRDQVAKQLSQKRRDEAAALRRDIESSAERLRRDQIVLPSDFGSLAEDNRKLSAALDAALQMENERNRVLQSATDHLHALHADYDRIRGQLENGGGGLPLGPDLWSKRLNLRREAFQTRQRKTTFASPAPLPFTFTDLDEKRRRIPRLEQELVTFANSDAMAHLPPGDRTKLLDQGRQLLDYHTKLVANLSDAYARQSSAIVDMEAREQDLRNLSAQYTRLAEQYVLRLPGSPPLWEISFGRAFSAWSALFGASLWAETLDALGNGLLRFPWLILLLILAVIPPVTSRLLRRHRRARHLSAKMPKGTDPRGLVWRAALALFRSYPIPLAILAAGIAIWSAAHPGTGAAAVGSALLSAPLPWFLLNLWRHACNDDGLLRLYADMPQLLTERLWRRLSSVAYFGIPLWILTWFAQSHADQGGFQALGGVMSVLLAAVGLGFWVTRMRPAVFLRGSEPRWPAFWQALYVLVMALGLFWVVMALLGYNYGALLVIRKATESALFVTMLTLIARYGLLRLERSRDRQRARAILFYRVGDSEERRRLREERLKALHAGTQTPKDKDASAAPAGNASETPTAQQQQFMAKAGESMRFRTGIFPTPVALSAPAAAPSTPSEPATTPSATASASTAPPATAGTDPSSVSAPLTQLTTSGASAASAKSATELAASAVLAASAAVASSQSVPTPAVDIPAVVEAELNESLAGARRLVYWLFGTVSAVVLLALWSDLFPLREWLDGVVLWHRDNGPGLTVLGVLIALIGGLFFYVLSGPLGGWVNLVFFGWHPAERGTRVATAALIRYALVGTGIIWTLRALGMAWSDAQWLIAALGVGLGFGLQEIVLNFVCGIILLFERPVRVGDTVTIGDAEGTISRIRIRTTTLVDWNRKELIIPNKELVIGRVNNWTLSDTTTRLVIPVGVAYGSDLQLVQRLLVTAAAEEEAVLDDPPASVYLLEMAGSSLNFELRIYVGRLEDRLPAQHRVRLNISRLFQQYGVSIPFPQLDVHIDRPENTARPRPLIVGDKP